MPTLNFEIDFEINCELIGVYFLSLFKLDSG